jgi:hypothetical protein
MPEPSRRAIREGAAYLVVGGRRATAPIGQPNTSGLANADGNPECRYPAHHPDGLEDFLQAIPEGPSRSMTVRAARGRSAEPRPSWRAPAALGIELCPAGIDPTMRFADLLGGGPGLEFGLLLQGGALDLEIAELLGGRRTVAGKAVPQRPSYETPSFAWLLWMRSAPPADRPAPVETDRPRAGSEVQCPLRSLSPACAATTASVGAHPPPIHGTAAPDRSVIPSLGIGLSFRNRSGHP